MPKSSPPQEVAVCFTDSSRLHAGRPRIGFSVNSCKDFKIYSIPSISLLSAMHRLQHLRSPQSRGSVPGTPSSRPLRASSIISMACSQHEQVSAKAANLLALWHCSCSDPEVFQVRRRTNGPRCPQQLPMPLTT